MTANHIGPEKSNAQHAPRQTILSVDSSEANRYLRSRILRAAGYEVIEADKGSDALSLAAEKQPCLILLDIQLPDMNGFAVCRRLKANPRTAPIPVLHVSSVGRRDHSYPEALESGADAYLREPVQASVLLAVITALVRAASAEARERKSERLAVDILESVGEAIYLLDQDYRFTYVNAEAERLLGFDRSALLGKTHGQVFPDSAAPRVDREFRRVMTERTASFFENYYEPGGKWHEIKASPVSGGGIAVHFRDVTGRKQAEESRQRLVADLRERTAAVAETALFPEQNPQPILRIRGDGVLLYANSSSIGLLAEWNCAVDHSVPGFLRQAVEGARTEGAVRELDIEVNGREYSFLITPIRDAAYANLYGRDITERKLAEQALRESEERFHTLADNIAQLAWMAHGDGRAFWYNQRWHEYAGTPAGNARPFEADGVIHPEHARRVATRLHQSFQTGGPWEDIFPLRGSDGQYRWFLGRALPVRHGTEEVVRWFGTCTDITAQKRTEAALRRSNNDLQQFAYIATHDLREPLRNIATYAELLDRSIKGDIANVAPGRCIDVITGAARRMETLITSVLSYARITADAAHSTGMVDANSALAEALAALQTGIAETGADVTRDELPAIEGDRMLIVQLFQNLVSNSIKYRLASVPPQIHVGVGRRVDEWLFSVRDNGQGFKPEYAERIFGMFKRLHGDEIAGTGIGLAICKAVVERHGGQIWAEARPGEGATFYFTIPSAAG